MTTNDILKTAGQIALDKAEENADMVWEFAYSTLTCDDDEEATVTVEELEAAFDRAVMEAGRARKTLAQFCADLPTV